MYTLERKNCYRKLKKSQRRSLRGRLSRSTRRSKKAVERSIHNKCIKKPKLKVNKSKKNDGRIKSKAVRRVRKSKSGSRIRRVRKPVPKSVIERYNKSSRGMYIPPYIRDLAQICMNCRNNIITRGRPELDPCDRCKKGKEELRKKGRIDKFNKHFNSGDF